MRSYISCVTKTKLKANSFVFVLFFFVYSLTFLILERRELSVPELVKLNAVIRWGVYQTEQDPDLNLRDLTWRLLNYIDYSKVKKRDIVKYVEPYEIFSKEELLRLINKDVRIPKKTL